VDTPSPQDEPYAYVLVPAVPVDDWWPPATRAEAIERARRAGAIKTRLMCRKEAQRTGGLA
jgi:hypothetical protein